MFKLRCLGLGLGVVVVGLLTGCGEAGHEAASEVAFEDVSGEHAAPGADVDVGDEAEVIAEVTHEGARYQFIDVDGTVALSVEGKLAHGEPALVRLVEEHGALTSLEIFYALSADDAVPDERLVAAHREETRELERPDDAVKQVELGPQPVEKKLITECVALAKKAAQTFGNLYPTLQARTANGAAALGTPSTTRGVGGALCNDAVAYGAALTADFHERLSTTTQWVLMKRAKVVVGDYAMYGSKAASVGKQLRVSGAPSMPSPVAQTYYMAVGY